MNSLILLIVGIAVLICGYIFYGGWLVKQWGVGEVAETPAHTMEDGIDYVPAKAPVLMGHHFSSIAGAGPITGPISAAGLGFGWLPITLWILIGGIFFGGVHDFGALFASVRHKGQSIGEIISANMSKRAKRLFLTFAYLTLILVVAAFASIVAGTFGTVEGNALQTESNASVAMISLLFILMAIIFGFAVYRRGAPLGVASVAGVIGICLCIAIGLNFHPIYLSSTAWMWICGVYITIASLAPVWILLQPRDYLSSFLLYGMLIIAVIGVVLGHPNMVNAEGVGLTMLPTAECTTPVFPVLFTTVACGAISGFHSLVSSGTTSKQLDKEIDAKPIAYGGMLIECALAIVTLCAVGYAYQIGTTAGATDIFAGGIAGMIVNVFGLGLDSTLYSVIYSMLILAYSTFCLTSLDTATRLARFMFQEFFTEDGKEPEGFAKVLCNKYVATIITVVLGILLGLNGYAKIWALFGSANQLLAALALLAVATWLGNAGKNNKMFLLPMGFMLIVTICSLFINTKNQIAAITAGGADWGPWVQAIVGVLLIVLAIVLAIEGIQTISKQKKAA